MKVLTPADFAIAGDGKVYRNMPVPALVKKSLERGEGVLSDTGALVVETGKIAQLANGACLVRYGETVVNVAVTASAKPRDGVDFFPLSVDYEEKLYSVGKIPGC